MTASHQQDIRKNIVIVIIIIIITNNIITIKFMNS